VLLGKDAPAVETQTRGGTAAGKGGNWGAVSASVRMVETRVKTARGRKKSSTRWLHRQLNDPYVAEARARGLRSRAAFKLIELDERFDLLKPGLRVVDLGAAPGGWTQIAVERVNSDQGPESKRGKVVGLDILEWDTVPGAECITMDFLDPDAPDRLKAALGGPADLVLSDMAAPTSGHPQTDHLRIMTLLETAWQFAEEVLAPGGTFVCKVFQGGTEGALLNRMKALCETVKHAKPPASRKESAELYVIAQGFKGRPQDQQDGE
jgi:23S rRNA (uridine2552-2'-O)-methyltransferase